MIQEGALRDPQVDAAIGFHLANTLPVGQIAAQPGPITAATDGFVLTITGKGGHAARPHLSVDPVAVSFQVGTALHTLMTRERSPAQPAVLTIGAIHGGTAGNVIADSVELRGTLRTYDPQLREHLRRRVEEVVDRDRRRAARRGPPGAGTRGPTRPASTAPTITALMQRATVAVLGAEALVEHEPSLGGDDMAFFLAAVPGCYARLGSANAGRRPRRPPPLRPLRLRRGRPRLSGWRCSCAPPWTSSASGLSGASAAPLAGRRPVSSRKKACRVTTERGLSPCSSSSTPSGPATRCSVARATLRKSRSPSLPPASTLRMASSTAFAASPLSSR